VFIVGGVDERNMLHIKHVVRERMDAMQIVDTIFKLAQRFQVNMMVMEKGTIEKALGPYIRADMMKRGKFLNIHAITPSTDKVTRARSIQARMRAQGVKFDTTKSWYIHLEQEMLRFPKDLHDDQVDAMSYLGLIIDRFQEGPTIKELEQEDYEEDQSAYAELDMNEGRNSLTGY
jgi:predicted phage terminase large subunit-like protein